MVRYVIHALKTLLYYPFAILSLLLSVALCTVLYFPLILGTVMGAYQVFLWVHTGNWYPYPLRLAFETLEIDLSFAYNPENWYVLANLVRAVFDLPLALFLLIGGVALASLGSGVVVKTYNKIKEVRKRFFGKAANYEEQARPA
jgi:hypothetical protein